MMMRERFSCFSERSVLVSPAASCSSKAIGGIIAPTTSSNSSVLPAVRNAITCLYRTVLSNHKHLLITVTWVRTHLGLDLNITFGFDKYAAAATFKLSTTSRFLRKKKGSRVVDTAASANNIEVFWEFSAAKYGNGGPEPVGGFYVVAVVDSEIALILGDHVSEEDARSKFTNNATLAAVRCSMVSRQEHCSGSTMYATRAQFSETGAVHDILIRCGVGEGKDTSPGLSVSLDKKVVTRMKRLQWNFRGNQTIFVDGLLVDLMWDLHGWFFAPATARGRAVFMFRTRSGLDSRLWLEEDKSKSTHKEQDRVEFSLVIYASI